MKATEWVMQNCSLPFSCCSPGIAAIEVWKLRGEVYCLYLFSNHSLSSDDNIPSFLGSSSSLVLCPCGPTRTDATPKPPQEFDSGVNMQSQVGPMRVSSGILPGKKSYLSGKLLSW